MSHDTREDPTHVIARAVLYEGYMLWSGDRSAVDDDPGRWAARGVFPREWTESGHPDDACTMRAECLVEVPRDGEGPAFVDVRARFLQVVERRPAVPEGEWLRFVDELQIGSARYAVTEEAAERELQLEGLAVDRPDTLERRIVLPAGADTEWIHDEAGSIEGALVRSWSALSGKVHARSELVAPGITRVRVVVTNETSAHADERGTALRRSLISMHLALHAQGARFVSMSDPPQGLRPAADGCRNEGCWPVLVGDREQRTDVLASPVLLSDFPRVAAGRPPGPHGDARLPEPLHG